MGRRRTLLPDEHALWLTVAKTARPMRALRPESPAIEPPITISLPDAQPKPPQSLPQPLPMFTLGEKARTATAPRPNLTPAEPAIRMDAKAFAKMTRGKLAPEARIDLHGMTMAEAHPDLIAFILNAQAAGMRLVLVITGKGKPKADHGPIPQRTGVLRHQVPQWLRLPPLGNAVLQVAEAHLRHGGSGAFYVYLRRS